MSGFLWGWKKFTLWVRWRVIEAFLALLLLRLVLAVNRFEGSVPLFVPASAGVLSGWSSHCE